MPAKDNPKPRKRWYDKFRKRSRAATQSADIQSSEQGSAEHGSQASSLVAKPCAPPSPSAVDAQAAQACTVTRFASNPKSAEASQTPHPSPPIEPQPKPAATESTEQPTSKLSTSERLWNAAFDKLEEDNAELVGSECSGEETREFSTTELSAKLKDPAMRQEHMKELVQKGQEKISKAAKITAGVGDVADFILSAKKMVDTVLQTVPHAAPAALPWAGVCIGLQILRNPAQATKSNLAGIAHVTSRMDWYCALTEHLLDKNNITASNNFQAILHQLEGRVVELYKALLMYQMKSVCSYYRNQQRVVGWDAK
ncbi:hypothetical protein QBC46DRAFT_429380 [Diplogelasinospora grovesii]|uniref:NWD NACHT-NTPase N-terminal domain-containing protein n=1 Tax=Diplogelasinospora grovesii TaxID=303347 RepID=A0AAN6MXF3_9PEZI|nr:hypothetical protein QBC46DRAFT_429380 [Diplogelasinospora grovesii]